MTEEQIQDWLDSMAELPAVGAFIAQNGTIFLTKVDVSEFGEVMYNECCAIDTRVDPLTEERASELREQFGGTPAPLDFGKMGPVPGHYSEDWNSNWALKRRILEDKKRAKIEYE